MNQKVWQSKHFKSIFETVYVTTFTLVILALVIMHFAFLQVTGTYLNSVMSRFIETAYSTIDHQISNSQNNALKVSMSTNGTTLFSQDPVSTVNQYSAIRNVDNFVSQDPGIHSVLFYNNATEEIFMFGKELTYCKLKDFYDKDIINLIFAPANPHAQYEPRVIKDSPYSSSTSTVLTCFYHLGNGNYVITNLDVKNIFSILHNDPSVYSKASTSYLVSYNQDKFVYDSIIHEELEESQELLLGALSDHNWKESFDAKISDVKYHFHVLEDPVYNLQMVSIIRQSDISASYVAYLFPFLAIVFAVGLLALFVNLKVSTRLYSPIARIRLTLPKEGPDDESVKDVKDEVEYITHRISDASNRLNALFNYKEKSLSISQEAFLKNQLLYSQYTDEEFWEQCVQEELPYRNGDSFVLLYAQWHPMNESAVNDAGDQGLLCFALGNVVHELFDVEINVRDLPFEKDGIAFLFYFQGDVTPNISHSVLKSIQNTFSQYFKLSISFFISDAFTQPHQLCPTMQKLQELSDYQFFYEEGCVLRIGDVDFDQLRPDICPVADMTALESAVRTGDEEACHQILDAYFQELPHYTKEAASASINVFASKTITMLQKIETTYSALPTMNYHQIFTKISTARTLVQTHGIVTAQLDSIIDSIKAVDTNTMGIDARDVQQYLEKSYQDFSISAKSVAQHFHVSVPYLNRIFKQKTGESISFYIKKLRLEHARRLLLTSSHPVEVIAKTVGFENTKYFYSMFKTEYGVSPSTYRTSNRNSPKSEETGI